MCGPHFCSMTITQDVREYAATHGSAEETAESARERREKAGRASLDALGTGAHTPTNASEGEART